MTGPHPDPLDPMQALEPAAAAKITSPGAPEIFLTLDQCVAMSTAISLKRIADVLTGSAEGSLNPYFFDQAAYHAGQSFERGRR